MKPLRFLLLSASLLPFTLAHTDVKEEQKGSPPPLSLFSFEDAIDDPSQSTELEDSLAALEKELSDAEEAAFEKELEAAEKLFLTIEEGSSDSASSVAAEEKKEEEALLFSPVAAESPSASGAAPSKEALFFSPVTPELATPSAEITSKEALFFSPVIAEPPLLVETPQAGNKNVATAEKESQEELEVVEDFLISSEDEPDALEPPAFPQQVEAQEQPSAASLIQQVNHISSPTPLKEEEKLLASEAPAFFKKGESALQAPPLLQINLQQVFAGSPWIYSLLLAMSVSALFIWLYQLFSLRHAEVLPKKLLKPLRLRLSANQYDEALSLLSQNDTFFSRMIMTGIASRKQGMHIMMESMKVEGKRATVTFWQRMALLNDIAIIAPMVGLLGTVLGMFYAFYDLNRSKESVAMLFDGLGISVGTTVAGLIVAIFAMVLHSTAKYRLVRLLAKVENEAYSYASLIENKVSIHHGE